MADDHQLTAHVLEHQWGDGSGVGALLFPRTSAEPANHQTAYLPGYYRQGRKGRRQHYFCLHGLGIALAYFPGRSCSFGWRCASSNCLPPAVCVSVIGITLPFGVFRIPFFQDTEYPEAFCLPAVPGRPRPRWKYMKFCWPFPAREWRTSCRRRRRWSRRRGIGHIVHLASPPAQSVHFKSAHGTIADHRFSSVSFIK